MPQAKQLDEETAPSTNRQAEPTATPGHWPCPPEGTDAAPHTSRQALNPGPPEPCSQRPWEPVPPSSWQMSAPMFPGSWPCPPASLLKTSLDYQQSDPPALGHPQPHSLPEVQHQLRVWLGPGHTYQQANTSLETLWALLDSCLGIWLHPPVDQC